MKNLAVFSVFALRAHEKSAVCPLSHYLDLNTGLQLILVLQNHKPSATYSRFGRLV